MRPLIKIKRLVKNKCLLCIDCLYYDRDTDLCICPELSYKSPVDGTLYFHSAFRNRDNIERCGPTGDYWESKE